MQPGMARRGQVGSVTFEFRLSYGRAAFGWPMASPHQEGGWLFAAMRVSVGWKCNFRRWFGVKSFGLGVCPGRRKARVRFSRDRVEAG